MGMSWFNNNEENVGVELKLKRDEDNKIVEYVILIKEQKGTPPWIRKFKREEVEKLYKLYTVEGSNLTQKQSALEFPDIEFSKFKKIIKAFNLTKADLPIPQHIIEESSHEEATQIALNYKRVGISQNILANSPKYALNELKKVVKTKINEEEYVKILVQNLTSDITPVRVVKKAKEGSNSFDLHIYLSDMHIGAKGASSLYVYENGWDVNKANEYLDEILYRLTSIMGQYKNIRTIRILDLGDNIDGIYGKTIRGDHHLPQNLDSIEQCKGWITLMNGFITKIHKLGIAKNIEYYSVGDSNHSGVVGVILNMALSEMLKTIFPDMKVYVSEKNVDHFSFDDKFTFIYLHGKDGLNMSRPMPVVLDEKTKNYFTEYIISNNICKNHTIRVIKGDTHQSSLTSSPYFEYRNCLPLFPGSDWQKANFGNSRFGVTIDLIDLSHKTILTSDISLQQV